MLVSNHVSYLDILVHLSQAPCAFVSKADLQNVWFVGTAVLLFGFITGYLGVCMGNVWVGREQSENTVQKIQERLDTWSRLGIDRHFCIFPEGTTTNGKYLSMIMCSPLSWQQSRSRQGHSWAVAPCCQPH